MDREPTATAAGSELVYADRGLKEIALVPDTVCKGGGLITCCRRVLAMPRGGWGWGGGGLKCSMFTGLVREPVWPSGKALGW